jgi:hypothetical protein
VDNVKCWTKNLFVAKCPTRNNVRPVLRTRINKLIRVSGLSRATILDDSYTPYTSRDWDKVALSDVGIGLEVFILIFKD